MPTILLDFSFRQSLEPAQAQGGNGENGAFVNGTTPAPRIPPVTDLSAFRAESVLCIVDNDNLDISLLKPHGLQVRYDRLLNQLRQQAWRVSAVAVITSNPGDRRREEALQRSGWEVVSIPREIVLTFNGPRMASNADPDLCFELGARASADDYTAVCLGTGDGDLAVSCSRGLKRSCGNYAAVHTLSVAGATSARLRTRQDLFASSILLGRDLLERIPAERSPDYGGSHNARTLVYA